MDTHSRSEIASASGERRDFISSLPVELKGQILEHLPIKDAARTAVLSTQWNDAWLRHDKLIFDGDFIDYILMRKGIDSNDLARRVECKSVMVDIVTKILMLRAGQVNTFLLDVRDGPIPDQSDLDLWCRFLVRNGIEVLTIIMLIGADALLPFCIFSCPTIKEIKLNRIKLVFPVNTCRIFPNVTSLYFGGVEFELNVREDVYCIPNLEMLELDMCQRVHNFEITAPKLKHISLSIDEMLEAEWRWLRPHCGAIKELFLFGDNLSETPNAILGALKSFPTAVNLQRIGLYVLSSFLEQCTFTMLLLQKSPNLRQLWISTAEWSCFPNADDIEAEHAVRLFEDPEICIDLKMLNMLKIYGFMGCRLEMLFVKALLSKSPALDKVFILTDNALRKDEPMFFKIKTELLNFARASPKAEVVFEFSEF